MRIENGTIKAILCQYFKMQGYTQSEMSAILCEKPNKISYFCNDQHASNLIHNAIADYLNSHCDEFCEIKLRSVGTGWHNVIAFKDLMNERR